MGSREYHAGIVEHLKFSRSPATADYDKDITITLSGVHRVRNCDGIENIDADGAHRDEAAQFGQAVLRDLGAWPFSPAAPALHR